MRGRKLRWILGGLLVPGAVLVAVRMGVQHTSWLGPLLADSGRAVVGAAAIARLEELVYGLEERWARLVHSGDAPRTHWETPLPSASVVAEAACPAEESAAPEAFVPKDVGPLHGRFAAAGDGVWTPMAERNPERSPRMYKTLLHPDSPRPYAAVAVVAMDLARVELHLEPGVYVPEATEPEARGMSRPGLIPAEHRPNVLAAFNGGFKTEHGRLGMHARGVTLVRAQPWGCTVLGLGDGRILIDTEAELPRDLERVWWRQGPQCLVRNGQFGAGVLIDENTNWGNSPAGSTFIRRSAVGIDAAGKTLYVGIGDPVTAGGIARAMRHVGATTVAQLDVNWSLPKFLLFAAKGTGGDNLTAEPLFPGLSFSRGEYVRDPSSRDFFYVLPKRASR